ncbi:MarR family winged helix-turn-helix transcriptional regulator [Virgibacillus halodenitrificans]|jgi:DNA-binding MarR family transcriptional regulator|uniref:MarR family transcriptional regulator n=1 Tax=Virgibacillus halodenitrificans TaxID=1482 RepID=A0AAC9NKB8_VIRHA|nr:helix-turn-helix domain-containing protein [Virgibacillus halodenitrificans]APC47695.1 MarR family transcriptional regulator [Virgibacillus halodenitrificans]MBD1222043.1 winged helix-turn-helix transcriptional regulator [Virgibacillus halodenitrificans]MYL56284.1 MarR family transcriptional regulator [Virgibacillus halodenitrificans]CDQ32560.1 transcriptional regulator SlyA [Virgibacillus halodenitrificans]
MDKKREEQLNETLMLFYFAYRTFTNEPDRILEEHGIQRLHHRILFFVARTPNISVHELLKTLEVSKQALHAPMRQLIEMGYITSEPAEYDRRVRELCLTEKGQKLERQLSNVQRGKMNAIFETMGPDSEETWKQVMKKIIDNEKDE